MLCPYSWSLCLTLLFLFRSHLFPLYWSKCIHNVVQSPSLVCINNFRLVNLKTLTRSSRRRKSPTSTDSERKKSPITLKIVKKGGSSVPVISKENMLKEVSSSSDEASEASGGEGWFVWNLFSVTGSRVLSGIQVFYI